MNDSRPKRDGADDIGEEAEREARATLLKWYHSGRPFFVKDTLQQLYDQLRSRSFLGAKVWIRGLDGRLVDFVVDSRVMVSDGPLDCDSVPL